jgi:biopolymer transport protein ExbB
MMTLFGDIGVSGLNDAARLAKGIALILNATLIGLLIAIPSLIAWNYFTKKVEVLAVEMEALCDDFVRRQYAEPKKVEEPKVEERKTIFAEKIAEEKTVEEKKAPDEKRKR